MRTFLFLFITSFFFLVYSCKCDFDESELLFTQDELTHFESYNVNDTLIYLGDEGSADTLVVDEITPTVTSFDFNCGFVSSSPNNEKSIFIRNLPINKYPYSDWETHDNATVKTSQWFFSLQVLPNPREVNLVFNFKNFAFVSRSFDAFKVEKDTIIGNYAIDAYYRFPHTSPASRKDSTYINEVFWTNEYGLIAYSDLKGEIFIKKE